MPRKQISQRSELQAVKDWFDYNTFVRKRYLRSIEKLPKNVLEKNRGASFPSILDIFTHVLDVYKSWFETYETGKWSSEIEGLSLAQAKKLESEVDSYLENFMKKTSAADLNNTFQYSAGKGKKKRIVTRRLIDMLWHLVEEELQHRGEMNALLWQEDIDPPITSWGRWQKSVNSKSKR